MLSCLQKPSRVIPGRQEGYTDPVDPVEGAQ